MRYANDDKDWTGYLTEEEYARYMLEKDARKWCFERMTDHERAMAKFEVIGKTRRAEARKAKEAAE